ncbi:MAG: hypothetical protein E7312_01035 [Clostridiales bacterium]|nr:hypothetical protein [Clostridiales bacterium]
MKSKIQLIRSVAVNSISVIAIVFIAVLLVATLNTAFPVGTPIYAEIAVLVFLIVWMYFSAIFARTVYEIGRVIAGNTCGYDFVAMGVCGIWLLKKDERFKLVRATRYGISCGTVMTPPACEYGYFPVIGYNNSGIIYCVAVAIISVAVCAIPTVNVFIRLSLIILAVQNALIAVTQALSSAQNGGVSAISKRLRRSYGSIERMWQLLKIFELMAKGKSISTMDESLFAADGNDVIDIKLKRYACLKLLYSGDLATAKDKIEELLQSSDKNSQFYNELTADYCVTKLILGEDFIPTKQFLKYTKASRCDIPLLRTRYAIELLMNKNEKKAQRLKKRFERITEDCPFAGTIDDEISLIKSIDKTFADND